MTYFDSDFSWEDLAKEVRSSIPEICFNQLERKSYDVADNSSLSWQKFHSVHSGKFFHVRNYIFGAFPELKALRPNPIILEVGCGNGSNIFSLLETIPGSQVYATDFSVAALRYLAKYGKYNDFVAKGRLQSFLLDIVNGSVPVNSPGLIVKKADVSPSSRGAPELKGKKSTARPAPEMFVPLFCGVDPEERHRLLVNLHRSFVHPPGNLFPLSGEIPAELMLSDCGVPETSKSTVTPLSDPNKPLDAILLIFVLSAIHPRDHRRVFENCFNWLSSGGFLAFRDYGLYDEAHVRATPDARLSDQLCVRPDGTFAFFFSVEEIVRLAESVGFIVSECKYACVQNTNRKDNVVLRRVFVNAKLTKP